MFRSYLTCSVQVSRPELIINLYSRLCSFVSSVNNPLTLLSRLLSTWSFFTSRFNSCVLKVIDSEDRKRFRSTPDTVGSSISSSNCIGEFNISVNCSDIVSRDLYSRSDYENGSALCIHGYNKQVFTEGRSRGFSSSMLCSNRTAKSLL